MRTSLGRKRGIVPARLHARRTGARDYNARSIRVGAHGMCALRLLWLFVAIVLIATPAIGQSPPTPSSDVLMAAAAAVRDTATHGSGAYAIVRSLTVEVGPRATG